jgi:hypothetical protein
LLKKICANFTSSFLDLKGQIDMAYHQHAYDPPLLWVSGISAIIGLFLQR